MDLVAAAKILYDCWTQAHKGRDAASQPLPCWESLDGTARYVDRHRRVGLLPRPGLPGGALGARAGQGRQARLRHRPACGGCCAGLQPADPPRCRRGRGQVRRAGQARVRPRAPRGRVRAAAGRARVRAAPDLRCPPRPRVGVGPVRGPGRRPLGIVSLEDPFAYLRAAAGPTSPSRARPLPPALLRPRSCPRPRTSPGPNQAPDLVSSRLWSRFCAPSTGPVLLSPPVGELPRQAQAAPQPAHCSIWVFLRQTGEAALREVHADRACSHISKLRVAPAD